MNRFLSVTLKSLATVCVCCLLFACDKITQHNFDKINSSMSMREVESILGAPTNSESVDIGGISGTSAVWKDKNGQISIQFLNDKVTVKSFSKTGDEKEAE